MRIQRETRLTAVSHFTCVCHTQDELAAILDRYAESAIETSSRWGRSTGNDVRLRPFRGRLSYAEELVSSSAR